MATDYPCPSVPTSTQTSLVTISIWTRMTTATRTLTSLESTPGLLGLAKLAAD